MCLHVSLTVANTPESVFVRWMYSCECESGGFECRTCWEVRFQLVTADPGESEEKECTARTRGNGKHMSVQRSVSCLRCRVVRLCVWDCVDACFKDSNSVTRAHTTEARKTKKCLCLSRESWQVCKLGVHFPFCYQLDGECFYFSALLLRSQKSKG